MKYFVSVLFLTLSSLSSADKWCDITDYEVDTYDHGGVYLHGNIGGYGKSFIHLGGQNGDFDAKATDRRLSMALSALMASRNLRGLFVGVDTCAEVVNYNSPVSLRVK